MVYLLGDVDSIKSFVFETSSLPQIRGGSELLINCEETIRSESERWGYRVIHCSGGSFLLEVPQEKAKGVKRFIENLYLTRTKMATVTVVIEDSSLWGDPTPSGLDPPSDGWAGRLVAAAESVPSTDFNRRLRFLGAAVREAKGRKRYLPFEEAFPFGRRCNRCGKRMAVSNEPAKEGSMLCGVCKLRDDVGRNKTRGRFNQKFSDRYGQQIRAKQPMDLGDLVEDSKRKYVAFLYADGNDIGNLLQNVSSQEEFSILSSSLLRCTQKALFDALWDVCGDALSNGTYWPFDIVNIGGDDVMVLLQAGYAWEVAVKFLRNFEQEVNKALKDELPAWPTNWPSKITASCGVAISDSSYPVRYQEAIATGLMKEAKRLAKSQGKPCSSANFLWLSSPVVSEEAGPLMSFYERPKVIMTARPYTLEQAEKVLELVKEFSGWPRHKRYRWAEAIDRGVLFSVNTILYDLARTRKSEREKVIYALERLEESFASQGEKVGLGSLWWRDSVTGKAKTALLDIVELAELRAMRPDVSEVEE